MAHEVDPSKLRVSHDGRLRGKVTVVFRDDSHFHLNRRCATGVAGTYRIDAAVQDGKIESEHSGTFGHAWSREGRIREHIAR